MGVRSVGIAQAASATGEKGQGAFATPESLYSVFVLQLI